MDNRDGGMEIVRDKGNGQVNHGVRDRTRYRYPERHFSDDLHIRQRSLTRGAD